MRDDDDIVTTTELNQQTASVLRRVKAGETIRITERGTIIALVSPAPTTTTGVPFLDKGIAEGWITPAQVRGGISVLPPPMEVPPGLPDSTDIIRADRDSEWGE